MKFLIDNNLSPLLADALKAAGHDAVRLRDLGMQAATDHVGLEHARADERILVSADTDSGGLLARSGASTPSVILIRRLAGRRAAEQAAIILANVRYKQSTADLMCVWRQSTVQAITTQPRMSLRATPYRRGNSRWYRPWRRVILGAVEAVTQPDAGIRLFKGLFIVAASTRVRFFR